MSTTIADLLIPYNAVLMIHADGVATWPDGTILTANEVEEVCERLRAGLSAITPEEADAHNARMIAERDSAMRTTPVKPAPKKAPGTVYLLRCQDRFKVGITRALHQRLETIGGQSPYPVEVIHTVRADDPKALESHIHRMMDTSRQHGEWFDLTNSQVRATIQAMNTGAQR